MAETEVFPNLFQPGYIGNLRIKNRLVQSPMHAGFAGRDGSVTPRLCKYYAERARGGVGMSIVENSHIDTKGSRGNLCQVGVYDDDCLPGLARLVEALKHNGAKAAIQLGHVGGQRRIPGAYPLKGASPVPCEELLKQGVPVPQELTIEEIGEIIDSFGEAARRAQRAGFDLVEVLGCHGYLITQFLSPRTNKRSDMYGGGPRERMRLALEVVKEVRKRVGPDFPLSMRISGEEYLENGITVQDSVALAQELEKAGLDVIHVSGGTHTSGDKECSPMYYPQAIHVHAAEAIKRAVDIPVIASGSITSPKLAEDILAAGKADFVSMGRALLADPYLPQKAREGRTEDIRPCIRCNECGGRRSVYRPGAIWGFGCALNFVTGREDEYATDPEPAPTPKKVAVIGGGPGGMEAARVAALRGHQVTLYEKRGQLGGRLIEGSVPDFKKEILGFVQYLTTQLTKLGVEMRYQEANTESILKEEPDAVIVATGATPMLPSIRGVDEDNVLHAVDVLAGRGVGATVVIAGGGMVGVETALHLAQQGHRVKIVEMLDEVATDFEPNSKKAISHLLDRPDIEILTGLTIVEMGKEGIIALDKKGNRRTITGDSTVLAMGFKPQNGLATQLEAESIPVFAVGDCVDPRRILDAVHEAYRAAINL